MRKLEERISSVNIYNIDKCLITKVKYRGRNI